MAIERAHVRELQKPWGVTDPRPWREADQEGRLIGELCFDRAQTASCEPALLLKILLTSQPLSIQVHPGDEFAQSIGLPHGKTEAWYILDAQPGAAVALGLKQSLTPRQLQSAIGDGSIANLVAWRTVAVGDTIFVPAGTIHAIGPGLVIAEIQQRSEATFRLFDHGRDRELHVSNAVATAHAAPACDQTPAQCLDNGRTLLISNPHFVFERLELEPDSTWHLDATKETWILVLSGSARIGALDVARAEALYAESERLELQVGETGVVCLVAYTGRGCPNPELLQRTGQQRVAAVRRRSDAGPAALSLGAHR